MVLIKHTLLKEHQAIKEISLTTKCCPLSNDYEFMVFPDIKSKYKLVNRIGGHFFSCGHFLVWWLIVLIDIIYKE